MEQPKKYDSQSIHEFLDRMTADIRSFKAPHEKTSKTNKNGWRGSLTKVFLVLGGFLIYSAAIFGLVILFDKAKTDSNIATTIVWAFAIVMSIVIAVIVVGAVKEWTINRTKFVHNITIWIVLGWLLGSIFGYQAVLSKILDFDFVLNNMRWLDENIGDGVGDFFYSVTQYDGFWWTTLRWLIGLCGFVLIIFCWYSVTKTLLRASKLKD